VVGRIALVKEAGWMGRRHHVTASLAGFGARWPKQARYSVRNQRMLVIPPAAPNANASIRRMP
jgi:hypothetical protein